jgi:YD repeat-containing protein
VALSTGSNYDANFYRSALAIDGGEEGQGFQVEFKVDGGDTLAHVSMETSEAPLRRLGIVAWYNKISLQYWDGTGYFYADLIDPISVGAWYVLRIKVTPEGNAYLEIWRKDAPGQRGVYALQMPAGGQYRFRHWIYSGNAWLDNYREFDALVTSYGYDRLDNLTVVTDTLGITTTMQYDMFGRKEAMQDPDMGDWSYAYDALGNLLTQTDAKSQVIGFAYDGLNRLVEKDYGDDGTPEAYGVAFNANYLLEVLRYMPEEDVLMEFKAPERAATFLPASRELDYLCLVMPLRLLD